MSTAQSPSSAASNRRGRFDQTVAVGKAQPGKLETPVKAMINMKRIDVAAIEPVFGQMKDRQGAGRFSMRGLERCRGEWHIDAAVHNLRKLHRDSVHRAENAGNSETTVRNPA